MMTLIICLAGVGLLVLGVVVMAAWADKMRPAMTPDAATLPAKAVSANGSDDPVLRCGYTVKVVSGMNNPRTKMALKTLAKELQQFVNRQ
jgi:hypothetical protein